jgi:transcriptional regulator with XRE-family HTH domain
MDSSFGARLRSQREERHVTLAAIAEQTKIKLSMLEGLERDDLSHWPTGIFRRSYVRAYAQAIGLEPDAVLREFLDLYPDPSQEAQPAATDAVNGGASASRWPPTRLRFLIGSAIGALPALRAQANNSLHADRNRPVVPPAPPAAPDSNRPVEQLAPPSVGADAPEPVLASVAAAEDSGREAEPDRLELSAVAHLCTRLARAAESRDLAPVLEDAAKLLGAVGLILWMWDPQGRVLRPVISHGYSDEVVAQLPGVSSDTDNAIATAFRSADACVVEGGDLETGAVAVPLTTPNGCAGVLALELKDGRERRESVRAFATILAAQLSTLVGYPPLAQAASA